ncbi:putative DNA-binding transcriptional regulator AlpA [Novosphingobium chloroacetimidivorans]|uniref:Putative DNA-binding transcriptional regulator AlpA n=1 Tax=Novosphingobium chloroacetimidivorans TaxID=1428314 RepID=A0A7W7K8M2_9SPHN|nr:helix-turn-helix domain-containing protein [Novosphingobium chloroacetimidivorans]MBB4858284.1 putative DNA-binding transcriptional regulator AlpA [Novosphingobium chloroacetimidivorans]
MGVALDTHQAAIRTGLASSTLRKLRLTGAGPRFLKLGRAVRYREADLEEWLSARSVVSTSESTAA